VQVSMQHLAHISVALAVCVHVCSNTYNLFSRVCAHIEVNITADT
jgi:hypothetical protein